MRLPRVSKEELAQAQQFHDCNCYNVALFVSFYPFVAGGAAE